jgi:hypothetical protein
MKEKSNLREWSASELDELGNQRPSGPEKKPTMPKGTVKVDVSDVYDWYKLGQHISNMKGLGRHDFGQGPPSAIISFGDEDIEHKYIKDLEKTGLTTTDLDPKDPNPPGDLPIQKTDPTYNVDEQTTSVKKQYHWLKPGELRGNYTDQQLRNFGFKQNHDGRWYIDKVKWLNLINDQRINEHLGSKTLKPGLTKK